MSAVYDSIWDAIYTTLREHNMQSISLRHPFMTSPIFRLHSDIKSRFTEIEKRFNLEGIVLPEFEYHPAPYILARAKPQFLKGDGLSEDAIYFLSRKLSTSFPESEISIWRQEIVRGSMPDTEKVKTGSSYLRLKNILKRERYVLEISLYKLRATSKRGFDDTVGSYAIPEVGVDIRFYLSELEKDAEVFDKKFIPNVSVQALFFPSSFCLGNYDVAKKDSRMLKFFGDAVETLYGLELKTKASDGI